MIIQCDRCGTRYRFDDTKLAVEGGWFRCSRCAHVFFLRRPLSEPPVVERPEEPAIHPEVPSDTFPGEGGQPRAGTDFDELSRIIDEIDRRGEQAPLEKEPFDSDITHEHREEKTQEIPRDKENVPREEGKRTLRTIVTFFLTPLLIILIAASVYFWLFPEIGAGLVDRISSLPGLEKIFHADRSDSAVSVELAAVDFTDIEERYVTNWIVGNVLVVEGQAINNNKRPVSDIRIRGKLIDSGGAVLVAQESYCGNILTDEELTNLTEKEMADALSIPGGSSFSNRNIASRGSVPFMLVFANPLMSVKEVAVELAGIKAAD